MMVLGGWLFLICEVPLYLTTRVGGVSALPASSSGRTILTIAAPPMLPSSSYLPSIQVQEGPCALMKMSMSVKNEPASDAGEIDLEDVSRTFSPQEGVEGPPGEIDLTDVWVQGKST